jgi:ATP-dependent helicase HepA
MTFSIGQRWISNTESQLGLGIITDLSGRQVSISFPAAEEERIYSIDNAPLSRIIYKEGEEITTSQQQKIRLTHIEERQGLFFYTGVDDAGEEIQLSEVGLNCFITLNTPQQRLLSGLLDKLNSYRLRIDTLSHASRIQQSKVRGLLGSRTSHLNHQVYIANEVAQRYAPRVLLADEVGLGKTIEAGMILHHQLLTGRARRVLIVVPQTLIHQWLVEMIRRFNLHFSIIDENRYETVNDSYGEDDYDLDDEADLDAEEATPNTANPFATENLILCSLDFLMEYDEAREHAIASGWDLLVVDEAHHLHWSEAEKSPEYECIEALSAQSKGVLLLTATPEQAGIASHFARLRLLDPSRFYDFAVFKKEEENYNKINLLVQELLAQGEDTRVAKLEPKLKQQLSDYLGEASSATIAEAIKNLLDRHGTGRILFRNTRAAIQGFPKRCMHSYPLECPELYETTMGSLITGNLHPESGFNNKDLWLDKDPRVTWLANKINELFPQKVLVICAKAKTALALEHHLKLKASIRSTAFHEGLTIIERDRAAAYFAEQENGAQVLICSEIGSEGRNFQFAHHLVLFDLPLNPDLLEQRIGRLDRIGQQHDIQIHVPYLVNTAQEILFRWYHEGFDLFTKSCSVGFTLYEEFEHDLLPLLRHSTVDKSDDLAQLIAKTQIRVAEINQALHDGRDRLLEMNSCNVPQAQALIADIEAEENCLDLENYMAQIFHEYGIDHEFHSEATEVLHPTEHMKTSHFPGLKEDGATVTYSRLKALLREDMEFLSWEHPMVTESMEMILDSEMGNAALATISIKSIQPGTVFLESFFTINCAAPKHLQLERFLPLTPIRVFMDISGKNLAKVLDYDKLNQLCSAVKRHLGYPIVNQVRQDVELILERSKAVAEGQLEEVVAQAKGSMEKSIGAEIARLEALKAINPAIRDEEVDFFKQQLKESKYYMDSAALKLQALRVIINKH